MTTINKSPEYLLAGEILELFINDCLVSSKSKHCPFPILEELLKEYCSFLGVRQPSTKQFGAALTARFPKVVTPAFTGYQVSINPEIVDK